jgi:S1-C subfamily serine protease
MQQLIATGSVSYAYVGLKTTDLTPSLARRFGYAVQRGAVVTDVVRDGPADDAGLRGSSSVESALGVDFPRDGDVIVSIDGKAVVDSEDIARIVTSYRPGQAVRVVVQHGGSRRTVTVHLGERSETPQ